MTLVCVLLATESVANPGFFDLFSESTLFVSAGVLTRIAGVLLGGGMRLFPGGTVHLRLAILFILGLAAAPVAISVVQVLRPMPSPIRDSKRPKNGTCTA